MVKFIKNYYKYFIYFFVILLCLIFFYSRNIDTIWNYGMAHAFRNGFVPYKDFNIITTLLYPFLMSIGLFISDTYLVYLIEQTFLCTILIFFLEKLLKEKYLLVVPFIFFFVGFFMTPNYNFLFFLLLIIILYLEKEDKSDVLIGIFLGLLFLTKHTLGVVIILSSLIYIRDIRRILKRVIYSLIPVGLFVIYLLLSNTLLEFINLSILGLFDFGNSNSKFSILLFFILFVLVYSIVMIIKDKKNYTYYYLLGSISFVIPIVDFYHVYYVFMMFLVVMIINHIEFNTNICRYLFGFFMILIFGFNIIINYEYLKNINVVFNNNLKYALCEKKYNNYYLDVISKYSQYDNALMIAFDSIIFDIETNHSISYYDIPLYGNFGYKGLDKMKNDINNMHDIYIFVSDNDNIQFASELVDEVRKIGQYVGGVHNFEIYYLK